MMPLKSIIDIELNDLSFQKFIGQYKAYETALAGAPAAWKAVSAGIDGSKKSFDELVGAAKSRLVLAKLTSEAEKVASEQLHRATGEATSQARSWASLAKDSKSFAGNVIGATKSLLQWSGVVTAVSGIIGTGGLFGIDRLAQGVAGQRKDASGIRVTPGELKSFDLNFGRLLDNPTGFLGGISESLSDVRKAAPYAALELSYDQERTKAPADVAIDVLRAEKRLADRTDQRHLGNTFDSFQLGMLGGSLQDFQRIKDRPLAELEDNIRHNQADRKGLDLTQGQQRAWENLQVQLSRAGDSIEKTFVVGLTKLADPLGNLSESFVKVVGAFASSPRLKTFIDETAAGLDIFASKIGTPEFGKRISDFADDVGTLASSLRADLPGIQTAFGVVAALGNALGAVAGPLINGRPPDPNNPLPNDPPGKAPDVPAPPFSWWNPGTWLDHAPGTGPAPRPSPFSGGASPGAYHPPGMPRQAPFLGGTSPATYRPTMGSYTGDITPALLASVEWEESKGRDLTNAKSKAAGYFQFIPSTARQYGVDVHNEQSSLDGARRYLTDLKKQFGGDTEKALAAYNWGPGNLKKDIDRFGADWKNHLPRETAKYIADITGRLPREAPGHAPAVQPYGHAHPDRSMRVTISNQTGGNANISVSQLAV
jgi:hypothetical protein